MDALLQDLKFSVRALLTRGSGGVLAIVTLALGIAACTAMFSVVDSVLLQPLDLRDPERVVNVYPTNPQWDGMAGFEDFAERGSFSYPELEDIWREGNDVLDGLAMTYAGGATLRPPGGEPERIRVAYTTPDYLGRILGVVPMMGRVFVREDAFEQPDSVVLSEEFWREHFDSDPTIVGQAMPLGGRPWTVVGVVPAGTAFNDEVPAAWVVIKPWENRGDHRTHAIARLAEGVSLERARTELSAILAANEPANHGGHAVSILPRQTELVRGVRGALLLLLGAACLLLVIAITNVAALLVGRMLDRQSEISVRSAMGATRFRLLRQLATESLVLSAVASLLGIGLAALALRGLVLIAPAGLPRIGEVSMNPRVMVGSLVLAAVAGLLAGIVPGLLLSANSLRSGLAGSRTVTSQRAWLQNGIAVAQITMATMLLLGGGLLARTVSELGQAEVGFAIDELVSFRVSLPSSSFRDHETTSEDNSRDPYAEIARELETLPGVRGVALTTVLPLSPARGNNDLEPKGYTGNDELLAERRFVSAGFFEVAGIELVEGRDFTDEDNRLGTPGTMIISESLARHVYPGESALGREIVYWGANSTTVVGVAADQRDEGLREVTRFAFYVPRTQANQRHASFMVRTDKPQTILPSLRGSVRSVEPGAALMDLELMTNRIRTELDQEIYRARLAGLLALLATLFSIMGIYGVTARSVVSRTREFGIRKALGAVDREVMLRVVRQAVGLGLVGGLLGLGAAYPVSKIISSQLWGVEFIDPTTLIAVAAILAVGSILAALGPGRRAGGVDPVSALRSE